jgi:hypothetical protein
MCLALHDPCSVVPRSVGSERESEELPWLARVSVLRPPTGIDDFGDYGPSGRASRRGVEPTVCRYARPRKAS